MYRVLSQAKLKTGEEVEVGSILCPDPEHAEQIKPFLAHKGGNWNWHVARALAEDLDGLQTRFYVAKLDREVISNVMTLEYAHAGILGHVFTNPAHRRKGAVSSVFDQLMPDVQRRGIAMTLGTGFDSAAYWIYHRYGFRSILPNTGFMRYATEEDYENSVLYVPGPAAVRPVLWRDWPRLAVLSARQAGPRLRSVLLGHYGPSNFEGPFLGLKRAVEEGKVQCVVLETAHDVVVGYATLAPDPRWQGHTWLLDVDVHPHFAQHTLPLIQALDFPAGKVQCYADAESHAKAAAFGVGGFRHEAAFHDQIAGACGPLAVRVYCRAG